MSRASRDLTVLKLLAKGRTLVFTANACDLLPKDVTAIAREHGAMNGGSTVNTAAAAAAVARLEKAAAPTLPTREAPPPAPKPTPRPTPSGDTTLLEVPIGRVHPNPDNPREDVGDVTELAASMKAVGLLQPLVARYDATGRLVLLAGHRRWHAAKHLGWRTIQVVVRRDIKPDHVLAAMLIENSHRKDLDPIEEARGLAKLKAQLGCNESQLAARVGRHQTHVSSRLRLLALPVEEQEQLRTGEMTLSEAKERARLLTGRIGASTGRPSINHFSTVHPLAAAAKARCLRLKHQRGRGKGVGGIACGSCWESVIRGDEREHIHEVSAKRGECAICGTHITTTRGDLPA